MCYKFATQKRILDKSHHDQHSQGKWWHPWDGTLDNQPYTLYIVGIYWVYPLLEGSKQGGWTALGYHHFPYETTNPSKSLNLPLFTRPHGGHWTTTQLLQHLVMIMCVNEGFGRFLKKSANNSHKCEQISQTKQNCKIYGKTWNPRTTLLITDDTDG